MRRGGGATGKETSGCNSTGSRTVEKESHYPALRDGGALLLISREAFLAYKFGIHFGAIIHRDREGDRTAS